MKRADMEGVFDPTLTDPLDQLKLAVREFVVFSAAHPELVADVIVAGLPGNS